MKENLKDIFALVLIALYCGSLSTCLGPEVHDLDFYSVSINAPTVVSPGSLTLTGTVDNNAVDALVTLGFLVSTSEQAVLDNTATQHCAEEPNPDGSFSQKLTSLDLQAIYYMKAFAVFDDDRVEGQRTVYSEMAMPFSFDIFLETNDDIVVINDRAEVTGSITGLQTLGTSAQQHGFLYSDNPNALLILNEGISSVLMQGIINDDSSFTYSIENLQFNTTYRVRTWAQTANDIYYSDQIRTFQIQDGWKQLDADPFQLVRGFGAVLEGNAYYLGCSDVGLEGCDQVGVNQMLYQFNPEANNGQGHWSYSSTDLQNYSRHGAFSFRLGDSLYVGSGESGGNPVNDLQVISISDIGMIDMTSVNHPTELARVHTVAFVLNDKAYIGSGELNGTLRNDFWEYTPSTGDWREMAPMPSQTPESSQPNPAGGRRKAMAFVLDGIAYVGAGIDGSIFLSDFWQFNPPQNSNDMGSWTLIGFFDGPDRIDGVYFSLDGKGYFGTGNDLVDPNYLNDFWVFAPNEDTIFQPRTALPTNKRTNALGFAIGSNGYLGYGIQRVNQTPEPLTDIWVYTPRQ